jgi:hypothetical protein
MQVNKVVQPNMDKNLIVRKPEMNCYLLEDCDLVSSNIICRMPTYMEGAVMSIVTKQAANNAPALFRIVRSSSVKSGIGAFFSSSQCLHNVGPKNGAAIAC